MKEVLKERRKVRRDDFLLSKTAGSVARRSTVIVSSTSVSAGLFSLLSTNAAFSRSDPTVNMHLQSKRSVETLGSFAVEIRIVTLYHTELGFITPQPSYTAGRQAVKGHHREAVEEPDPQTRV